MHGGLRFNVCLEYILLILQVCCHSALLVHENGSQSTRNEFDDISRTKSLLTNGIGTVLIGNMSSNQAQVIDKTGVIATKPRLTNASISENYADANHVEYFVNDNESRQAHHAATVTAATRFLEPTTPGNIFFKGSEPIKQIRPREDVKTNTHANLLREMAANDKRMQLLSINRQQVASRSTSSCAFSNSSCSWLIASAKYHHYSWQLGEPSSAFFIGGPSTSANVGTSSPGYAFVDGSIFRDVNLPDFYLTAWMTSELLNPTTAEGRCIQFKYNMLGASVQALRILRVDHIPTLLRNNTHIWQQLERLPKSNTNSSTSQSSDITQNSAVLVENSRNTYLECSLNSTEIIWQSSFSTHGLWLNGHVLYSSGYQHRLVFEAVPRLSAQINRGYAAVDDVEIKYGSCGVDCGFEGGLCDWQNSADDNFDWIQQRGSTSKMTGPARDQSSIRNYSRVGGYIVAKSTQPRRPGDQAWLESSWIESQHPVCVVFYTNMFGVGVGELLLQQITESDTPKTVWSIKGGSGSQLTWHFARATFASDRQFKIRIIATVGETGTGDIAIDSVSMNEGSCTNIPSSSIDSGLSCSFLEDMCHWKLSGLTQHLWRRYSGGRTSLAPSSSIRPIDHQMMFTINSYQHREGTVDRFVSPPIHSFKNLCMTFWVRISSFLLSTPRIGSLQVLIIHEENNSSQLIWRIDNHLSHEWLKAQVGLKSDQPFRIAFEGIRGSGVNGVMTVDDIVIFEKQCDTKPVQAVVSPLYCSFDKSMCGWTNDNQQTSSWTLSMSDSRVPQLLDHTHGTESGYLFFDPFNNRRTARLVSGLVKPSSENDQTPGRNSNAPLSDGRRSLCISLRYTSIGGQQEDAVLSVRVRNQSDNASSQLLWQVTQAQTGHPQRQHNWHYGQLQVHAVSTNFQLIIEAIGMQAGFAVDDIRATHSSAQRPCPMRPQAAQPSPHA